MKLSNNLKGAILLVIAGFIFAVTNLLTQLPYFLNMRLSASVVTLYQYFFAFIFLLPYLIRIGIFSAFKTEHLTIHIFRTIVAAIGVQFFVMSILRGIAINQVTGLILTSAIFVVIGSALFLHETVGIVRWSATIIGAIGGCFILEPWSASFTWYAILPIIAAVFWAIFSILTKKASAQDTALTMTAYFFVLTTPVNLVKAYLSGASFLISSQAFIYLLLLGFLTAIAQFLIAKVYSLADASYVQPFDHVKIIFNVMAGWIFLNQIPSHYFWLGICLVIGSVVFISSKDKG